jgi:hypothetical protein
MGVEIQWLQMVITTKKTKLQVQLENTFFFFHSEFYWILKDIKIEQEIYYINLKRKNY